MVWWGDEFGFVRAAPNLAQQRYFTQAAVGGGYVIAMDSDGQLIHWGASNHGQGLVPGLPAGVHALACDAGIAHSVAVGSDGSVIAWGNNQFGQSAVPQLPPGVTYTKVRCGPFSTVAFRSDGGAVLFGNNDRGQCNAPPALPPGVRYVDAGASYHVSVLLRSDGLTVSLGDSSRPEFHVPQLPSGLRYEQLVITHNSGVGLRSDGRLQYWGSSLAGREPPLPVGVSYVEIAGWDAVLAARRSDGSVVAWTALPGWNFDAPPLAPGTSYIEVSAAVDVVAGVVGPTSTYVSFASGCPGSTAVPQLVPRDTPRIGRTLPVLISPLPANLAFLVAGWTRLAQPLDLANLGMPGCFVHIQGDAVALVGGVGGIGRFEMTIPNTSALKGLRFHQQALVLDPQAPNPAGAVLSDAAEAVIGH